MSDEQLVKIGVGKLGDGVILRSVCENLLRKLSFITNLYTICDRPRQNQPYCGKNDF